MSTASDSEMPALMISVISSLKYWNPQSSGRSYDPIHRHEKTRHHATHGTLPLTSIPNLGIAHITSTRPAAKLIGALPLIEEWSSAASHRTTRRSEERRESEPRKDVRWEGHDLGHMALLDGEHVERHQSVVGVSRTL